MIRKPDLDWYMTGPVDNEALAAVVSVLHDSFPDASLREIVDRVECLVVAMRLKACGGSRQETADSLQVNRTTLFNKMRKYGLLDEESASRANRA